MEIRCAQVNGRMSRVENKKSTVTGDPPKDSDSRRAPNRVNVNGGVASSIDHRDA